MATTHIRYDDQTALGKQVTRNIQMLREGLEGLAHSLAHFTHMVDGDGTSAEHFSLPVNEGVYPTNSDAKASWDELQSLNYVMSQAEAAIRQAAAKHGV